MDNTAYIALSRQMALWKQMNIVSNNMANMNTAGYKQDNALFTSYINQSPEATGIGAMPMFFTQDYADFQNFAEGAFKDTGNTFDLAIKGDGFFGGCHFFYVFQTIHRIANGPRSSTQGM